MSWPTPQEYNEAIQNPRANLSDPDLREAVPEVTPLGLPKPVTGNFASVYRLHQGGRSLAVRCFFRKFEDMQSRYAAISGRLQALKLPYTVGFRYLGEGITVRREHYPILKMEWIDGQLLDEYVRINLGNPGALAALATTWLKLASALRLSSIAHGDLQHGNVMVAGGALRLVDYDGMYVQPLAGLRSLELGHPSYQHPARDASLFGPTMDNFSHWVIYTSLAGLAIDPKLWTELGAGDERLLFSRSDFINPSTSPAFRLLSGHPSERLRALAVALRGFLDAKPDRIPYLDAADTAVPLRRPSLRRHPNRVSPSSGEHHPEWLVTHMRKRSERDFGNPGVAPRLSLVGVLAALAVQLPVTKAWPPLSERAAVGGGVLTVAALTLLASYLRDGNVRRRLLLLLQRSRLCRRGHRIAIEAAILRRQSARLERRAERGRSRVQARIRRIDSQLEQRRRAVSHMVAEDMAPLNRALAELREDKESELVEALVIHQRSRVDAVLCSRRIASGGIEGMGWGVRAWLWARGVRSARDVDPSHEGVVGRLAEHHARSLRMWRASILEAAMRSLPVSLPPRQRHAIEARFLPRVRRIQRSRERLLAGATPILAALTECAQLRVDRLDRRIERQEQAARCRRSSFGDARESIYARKAQLGRRLAAVDEELVSYERLTVGRYLARIVRGRHLGTGRPALTRIMKLLWQ